MVESDIAQRFLVTSGSVMKSLATVREGEIEGGLSIEKWRDIYALLS